MAIKTLSVASQLLAHSLYFEELPSAIVIIIEIPDVLRLTSTDDAIGVLISVDIVLREDSSMLLIIESTAAEPMPGMKVTLCASMQQM